ncbi:MAG: methylmalonyl-CoA mutase family protein, partial [Thermoanaerobaculia bacterium]|nr:methylmalonyl-CoA mutase family protein [Thermoanaerobaculia bacterium]
RAERSASEWRAARDGLGRAAASGANLMPAIIEAVRGRMTLGEIADLLRRSFGEHRPGDTP